MHMPMEQALKQIGLPAEITEAILSQRGPYAPYLALAIACEQDDQSSIEDLAVQIEREVSDINGVHMDALLWAQQQSEL
jgi:EAL and modified HD-GYP domain-containing signal transduction protein